MARPPGPNATVAWLRAKSDPELLAGAAFLVSADLALTCAHVIRDHLDLGPATPVERPTLPVTLRFEALEREVSARVLDAGWLPKADIALLRLDEPLRDLDCAGLALSQPRPRENCYIYGATAGYQSTGQTVYAQLAVQPGVDGRRQLNPPPGGEHGYKIRRGFSGSPVFDELGNAIWGMVVTVETEPEVYVAFSTPAETLRDALREAQTSRDTFDAPPPRSPGPLDDLARDAVTAVRQEYEQRLAEERAAHEQQIRDLQQAVQSIAERSRDPAQEEPVAAALESLKKGDAQPAERILATLLDAAPERTPEERQGAAQLARSLGVLAYVDNTDRALRAYEMAARLDPDDAWSWIFLGRLRRRTDNLAAAERAFQKAREAAERAGDERDVMVADNELGDVRMAQGNLAEALAAYQAVLAIAETLAARDSDNALWQRDLSVSYDRIGDVRVAKGDRVGALEAYEQGRAIAEALAARDPANAEWQRDLSVSYDRIGNVRGRNGRSRGRARGLRGEPRHSRNARPARSRQRRVAARPLGQPQQDRRRAGRKGRS